MSLVHESYLYHLWLSLLSLYDSSALRRCLTGLAVRCRRQAGGSAVLRFLFREGALARAWGKSGFCRLLTFLINLPGWLLHKLYTALQAVFENSFFARLAFAIGDSTAIAQSWLIMLLWVIPFSHWNNAYSLMGFLLLLVLFYAGSMRRKSFRLDVKAVGFYPVLMLCAVFLAAVLSYSPSTSARFLLYHISCALCVLITVSAVRSPEDLKRLAAGGGVCVLVSSLYGVYQRIQGVEVNASYVDLAVNPGMPGRVQSFFDNPNTFAEVLILLLPLVLALILCSKHLLSRLVALGVAAVGVAALGMTYSRSSWVGIACALVVTVVLWRPRLIPAFFVLCILCVPLLPSTIWNRILTITNTSDTSTASRIPLQQAALAVIKKSPFSGAGLGTSTVQEYIKDFNLYRGEAPFVHAHNIYLQVWIETGLLGILGFVGSMLWNIKKCAHTVRRCPDSAARTITCTAAAALCGAMVCGVADYLWNYPRVMCIFWFVFAVALAGTKLCRQMAAESAADDDR